ncbi:hypothetical protein SAMN05421680_1421, partial [Xenorhabdus mauleonii]
TNCQISEFYILLTYDGIENPRVGGSIPPPGTNFKAHSLK